MNWSAARKRFWTKAEVTETEGGFSVALDDRPLRTPAKAPLIVPARGIAEEIATEWDAQTEEIDPATMPFTRLANAAIDNMGEKAGAVEEMLARYGTTDLVCYRADGPDTLRKAQAAAWDPLLDWLAKTHDIHLILAAGVMPVAQPDTALQRLGDWIAGRDVFTLMALHDLVTLPGSLVIGMAVTEGAITPEAGWRASRVDELYQADVWGADSEAEDAAATKAEDFYTAARMMQLLREVAP